MSNSFSPSKSHLLQICVPLALGLIWLGLHGQLDPLLLLCVALTLLALIHPLKIAHTEDPRLRQLQNVINEIAAGKIGNRITAIGKKDQIGALCWDINNMLDQLEACFREQQTTLLHASQGNYFRKAQAVGLHGEFRFALERTNASTSLLDQNARHMLETSQLEKQAQNEIEVMVSAAAGGDFSQRLSEDGKQGVFLKLAQDLNHLSSTTGKALAEVAQVLDGIARGDLTHRIETEYTGVFGQLKDSTNHTVAYLHQVIELEAAQLVSAAAHGDFSQTMDEHGKSGFFLQLSHDLNTLCHSTKRALGDIANTLNAVTQGDLTVRVEAHHEGIFDQLKVSTNDTVIHLHQLVEQIQDAVSAIESAAREIATGNQHLSTRTETQAASLEQTASSMEQLTSTVRQNADHAHQANQLARDASTMATQGGEVVDEVVQTMQAIDSASNEIVTIISVIDGIAFQTNILALNAAVEAARAGEQGRGFAVVASEVRHLAQRSATAAKEVKSLIEDSLSKVESGSKLAGKARHSMNDIVQAVNRVSEIIHDVSGSSQEQSHGIDQVNIAVSHLDETTQQNAALVEQATAAAQSLADQADLLSAAVASFKLR